MDIFLLILPIIALVATGFVCGRFQLVPEDVGRALITFCYYVAVPALLLFGVASEPVARLFNLNFIASFGGATVLVFLAGTVLARLAAGMDGPRALMLGSMCTIANTAFVALPILHAVLGSAGILPAAIANIIVVLLFVVAIIAFDRMLASGGTERSLGSELRGVALNPFLLATVLGVVISISGWQMPHFLRTYLELLAHAVTPCALFAIGMSIKIENLGEGAGALVAVAVLKLLVLPAIALGLALVLGLDAVFAIAATVCAAVPIGQTVFILADKFDLQKELAAKIIPITTMLSVATLIGWLVLLDRVYPGVMKAQ